jgi:large subunit ribosomal protein L21
MYAIVECGGRQYRVSPGEKFMVERLAQPAGSAVELPVLLLSDDAGVTVGKPLVEGKTLKVNVLGEVKGEKLIAFKYTPKKRYRRKTGHRQTYTLLQVAVETAPAAAQVKTAQTEPAPLAMPAEVEVVPTEPAATAPAAAAVTGSSTTAA